MDAHQTIVWARDLRFSAQVVTSLQGRVPTHFFLVALPVRRVAMSPRCIGHCHGNRVGHRRIGYDVGMAPLCYRRHRFPLEIIQHAMWLYLRFTLSYRDLEEWLCKGDNRWPKLKFPIRFPSSRELNELPIPRLLDPGH